MSSSRDEFVRISNDVRVILQKLRDYSNKFFPDISKLELELQGAAANFSLDLTDDDSKPLTGMALSTRIASIIEENRKEIERKREEASMLSSSNAQLRANLATASDADRVKIQSDIRKNQQSLTEIRNELNVLNSKRKTFDRMTLAAAEIDGSKKNIKDISSLIEKIESIDSMNSDQISKIDNDIFKTLVIDKNSKYYESISTAIFGIAVVLVIISFFYMANKSEEVRKSLFSNDSGLQFVTLFALVIAIILFGVLKILEGRELAALLGGLSGYILGRGTISRASTSPGTNVPPPNQQQTAPPPQPT